MTIDGFRTVGLALVTLLGAAHLSTAEATPLNNESCHDKAAGYAAGFCDGMGHDDWGSVTYTCNGDQPQILEVECTDNQEQEPTQHIA
jgi:hypothetical protein